MKDGRSHMVSLSFFTPPFLNSGSARALRDPCAQDWNRGVGRELSHSRAQCSSPTSCAERSLPTHPSACRSSGFSRAGAGGALVLTKNPGFQRLPSGGEGTVTKGGSWGARVGWVGGKGGDLADSVGG